MKEELDYEKIWQLLFRICEQFRSALQSNTPEHDLFRKLTFSQIKVLGCIIDSPDGQVKIKEIAAKLGITSGGVSQIVDNLVRSGEVVRRTSPQDRRVVYVSFSPEGLERKKRFDAFFLTLTRAVMRELPESGQLEFQERLAGFSDRLERFVGRSSSRH